MALRTCPHLTDDQLLEIVRRAARDVAPRHLSFFTYLDWADERLAAGDDVPWGVAMRRRLGDWCDVLDQAGIPPIQADTRGDAGDDR